MQDLEYLAELGATEEKLKAKFTAKNPSDKLKKLIECHSTRLEAAVRTTISEAPVYGAIDQALKSAESNVPFIQARWLAMQGKTTEEVVKAFKAFRLTDMLTQSMDPVTGTPRVNPTTNLPVLEFNLPLFQQVHVPLTYAYSQMRSARLFNERNVFPRYKYSPPRMTHKDMLKSEIVTSRIQRMVSDMGYVEDDKQVYNQMTWYGTVFQFPRESYWRHSYKTKVNGKVESRTMREGVRLITPHPRRFFWDRSEPLHTFNTDSGVSYAGYWDIEKFGKLKGGDFWNTESVVSGGYDVFKTAAWSIYNQFYPCVVDIPESWDGSQGVPSDRVDKEQVFLKDENDSSVIVATLFDRIIPKDYDLYDYDEPVWHRFLYANYGTVLKVEPLPYTPGCVFLHGYNSHQTVANSIALQLTPFEQLISNFLTQHTMSVSQNLERIRFVNTDIVPKSHLEFLQRMGDRLYQKPVSLGYSRAQDRIALNSDRHQDAVIPMPNQMVVTSEIAANLRLTLDVLERMLGFSPQEVGAAASHEQSATETTIVAGYSTNNLTYMGSGIDEATSAKKRLLYDAMYCYGDDEIWATVTNLTPERREALKELGFEIQDGAEDGSERFTVKGKKGALTIDSFSDLSRSGQNRIEDSKLGIAMLQSLGQVIQNPAFMSVLGVPQCVELTNYVWQMIGLPDDYRMTVRNDPQVEADKQRQALLQMIQQGKDAIVQQAVQLSSETVTKQIVPQLSQHLAVAFKGIKDQMDQLAMAGSQLAQSDQEQNAALSHFAQLLQVAAERAAEPQPINVPIQSAGPVAAPVGIPEAPVPVAQSGI